MDLIKIIKFIMKQYKFYIPKFLKEELQLYMQDKLLLIIQYLLIIEQRMEEAYI